MDIRYAQPDHSATLAGQARIQRVLNYNKNIVRQQDAAKVIFADSTREAQEAAEATTSQEKYKSAMTSPHVAAATNNLRKVVKYRGRLVPKAGNITEAGFELESRGIESGEAILGRSSRLTTAAATRAATGVGGEASRSVGRAAGRVATDSVGRATAGIMTESSRGLTAGRAASEVASGGDAAIRAAGAAGAETAAKIGLKSLGKAAGFAGAGVNVVNAGESLLKDFSGDGKFKLGGSEKANTDTKIGDGFGLASGASDLVGLGLALTLSGPVGLGLAAAFAGFGAITGVVSAIEGGIGASKQADADTAAAAQTHETQLKDIGEQMSVPTRIQKSVTAKALA